MVARKEKVVKTLVGGVKAALRFFEENGGRFTVCTGRCYLGFHAYSREIINAPVLLANGGMAYDYQRHTVVVDNGIGDEGIAPLRAVAFWADSVQRKRKRPKKFTRIFSVGKCALSYFLSMPVYRF